MKTSVCTLFLISHLFGSQLLFSQTHTAKSAGGTKAPAAKENYISHEISKTGSGDNGIYRDTLRCKIEKTDARNASGKQYQDIHVTLDEGDVICAKLKSFEFKSALALYNTVSGKLQLVKTIDVPDKISEHDFKLLYRVAEAGSYTLRISCKEKLEPGMDDFYSEYSLLTVISTPASGHYSGDSSFCSRVQFMLRQEATEYMQILGTVIDSDKDVLDKKKISRINYQSLFNLYDIKEILTSIGIDFEQKYGKYNMVVAYSSKEATQDYYDRLVAAFKACLGDSYKGKNDTNFGSDQAFQFLKGDDYYHSITIICDTQYNNVQLIM